MNVLKAHLRISITTLWSRCASQHGIAQRTGVDQKTIRRYARTAEALGANAPTLATGIGRHRGGGAGAAPRGVRPLDVVL